MSNDFLIKDARELLNAAEASPLVQHYRRTLPLGWTWQTHGGRSGRAGFIHDMNSSVEAVTRLQSILFVHSPSPKEAENAVHWHIDHADSLAKLPFGGETGEMVPESAVVRFSGGRFYHDDFRHMETADRIITLIDDPLKKIIELGSGTGGLARIMKWHYPKCCYIMVDLPDTLAFAMMFLRNEYPSAKWHWMQDGTLPQGWDNNDFVFCPVGMEGAFYDQNFDAFINTASLGEMKIETVKHWFDFVQTKTTTRYFFSVNRFLNTVSPDLWLWRQTENTSALQFDKLWAITDWELVPDFLRCPWQNRHARQVLIFAERLYEEDEAEPSDLISSLNASWNTDGNNMTIHQPALNCDFTMSGPLFKFWEAMRLNPSDTAKNGLLLYLRHLRNGHHEFFEEEPHIESAR